MASQATLCRLENRATRAAVELHELIVEQFIASFEIPPKEVILEFDATDDPTPGHKEGRFFHGYYDGYCFLPLSVFVVNNCWSLTCAAAISMRPNMPGRF